LRDVMSMSTPMLVTVSLDGVLFSNTARAPSRTAESNLSSSASRALLFDYMA
jgi:hypothetical protein